MKKNQNISISNNLPQIMDQQRRMELHEKRLQNMQPTLKAANHYCSTHLKRKPLAELSRIETIATENKALLKKLTNISPSKISKERPFRLAKSNRRNILQEFKMRMQNSDLLRKIKQAKPTYKNNKMASQRKVTEAYINSISKFKNRNLTPNKTHFKPFHQRVSQRVRKYQSSSFDTKEEDYKLRERIEQDRNEGRDGQKENEINKCLSKEKDLILNGPNEDGDGGKRDKIISIEVFPFGGKGEGEIFKVTYIVWGNKVSIQIDGQNSQSKHLQLPKDIFRELYSENLKKLHKSIKLDERTNSFFINLQQAAQRRYQKHQKSKEQSELS